MTEKHNKSQLNFGGFYGTIHDSIVEEAVANELGAIDKDSYRVAYCKDWLSAFNAEFDTEIEFKLAELILKNKLIPF